MLRPGKLGTLTLGQAPRADLVPTLDALIDSSIERLHVGLLDGLTASQIDHHFAPRNSEPALVTRVLDGSPVLIARAQAEFAAQQKVSELEDAGCSVILLLHTGSFAPLHSRDSWLVEPDRILPGVVTALVGSRRLGIVLPMAEQIPTESLKWQDLAQKPLFAAASPYELFSDPLRRAASDLRNQGAEILLLDCMGYTGGHRSVAASASRLPVLLSSALVARLLGELF